MHVVSQQPYHRRHCEGAKLQLVHNVNGRFRFFKPLCDGTNLISKQLRRQRLTMHGLLEDAHEHLAPITDTDVAMCFFMRLVAAKLVARTRHRRQTGWRQEQ